jgi:RimJ/RimL family protein N-acetyltransferase
MSDAVTFKALAVGDLPMLHAWLSCAHVAEWWEPTPSLEEVREDYLPRLAPDATLPLDAPAGVTQYIAYEGDTPFGFCPAYRVMAHQADGWWPDETDPFALGIDQFIGLGDRLNQGLGTRMLKAFTAFLFEDPRVTTIQTDPSPDNARAIACYRKVGFRDVGVVETLDGQALLMRMGRQ